MIGLVQTSAAKNTAIVTEPLKLRRKYTAAARKIATRIAMFRNLSNAIFFGNEGAKRQRNEIRNEKRKGYFVCGGASGKLSIR